jgi:hypothetical protein
MRNDAGGETYRAHEPATAKSAVASDRCPRCGGGFHCGANDAAPCACSGLKLDEATLAGLRAQFKGCLCLSCLRAIAAMHTPKEIAS